MSQQNFNELAGFDVEEESTSSTNSGLLNSDDVQSFETPSGWSSNPVVRVGVVGVVIGGILSLVAVLFGAFRPSPVAQQPETPSTSESSGKTAEKLAELKAQNDKLQKELLLKKQEELTEQPQESSEASSKPKAATKPASKPEQKSQPQQEKPQAKPQPIPQPLPVVHPPQRQVSPPVPQVPHSVSRPVVNSQPVKSLPAPQPRRVLQQLPIAPPESSPVESSDPSELIAKARAAGSHGQGGTGDKKPSPALPTSPAALDSVPKQVAGVPDQGTPNEQRLTPKEPVVKLESEQQPPPTTLAIGSSAKAVVETAWVSSDEESPKQFVVRLTETLPATEGTEGLSAGTKLVAEIGGVNNGGMVDAKIVAVVRGGERESLPSDALVLNATSGTPLVAKRQGGDIGSDLARLDAEGALISGVGEITRGSDGVGSLIPPGGNGKSDVFGQFLDGALNEAFDTLEERNKAAKEELQNRPVTWHLAQGTAVQVTVQGTVSLEPSENSAKKQPPQPETTPNFFPPGVDEEGYFSPSTTTPVAVPVSNESPPESEIPKTPLPPASVNNAPVQQRGGVQSPNPTVHSEPSVVKVWAGSGTNISFIPTGETIIRAWLDDPSMVTVDFDQPLCAADAQSCTSGSPSVVHLRLIEGVKVPNIPSANSSLLTVITETATGAQNLYSFRIERGTGEPEYHSIEISGN
ncbi:MAG: hypothetical protein F6K47_04020 [Symploca sp. SIO2E6]|nr:hypothetical protein [Symploca sp. SIO2E6]